MTTRTLSTYIIRLQAILSLLVLVFTVSLLTPMLAYADGEVTNCANDTDLHAKLAGGGVVTFNCASTPATILLTTADLPGSSYINITQTPTISGGGLITLQGNGGARIFNVDSSTLVLDGLTISNGQANNYGGALQVVNAGVVTITASTLVNNQATNLGGAVAAANSELNIINSTLFNNRAGVGGAIYIAQSTGVGKAAIINSTIYSNTASDGVGGGIRSYDARLTLANSTLSNNRALEDIGVEPGGNGGAIAVSGTGSSITLITNTTIFSNFASINGGGIQADSGSGSGSIKNSVVAGNVATTTNVANCNSASIISNGNNIDSGNGCNFIASGDLPNTDPLLGPLANNGGTTLTHALLPGSPAVNAADNTACAADPIKNVDQRGVLRPQGAFCDIGAVEETSSLAIAKSSVNQGGEPIQPGERITYTISVTNTSSLTATDGVISDTLPANTSFVTDSITLSPLSAGTKGSTPPTLASNLTITAGQSITVTYAVTVNTPLPNQTQIVNTASVTSSEVSQAQTSTVTDTVTSVPALSIQKSSLDGNGGLLAPGDTLTYTIVVANNSSTANATGGLISDPLPVNTTFVPGSIVLNPSGAGTRFHTPTLASNLTITAGQASR
ncbi:MAG: DUF11 domain-containing protein [Anaerolineales bacterium]|nr:DUF11 domain-containing protein [Anaerolineales bacterium]